MRKLKKRKRKVQLTAEETSKIIKNTMENGVLLWISTGAWGNRKKVSEQLMVEKFGKDVEVVRGTQNLVDMKEFRKVIQPLDRVKGWVAKQSLPWVLNDATFYIRKEMVQEVDQKLQEAKQEHQENLEEFITDFKSLEEKFAKEHPDIYNPANYPTKDQLRKKFRFEWGFQYITLPAASGNSHKGLTVLSKEMAERENLKFQERMKEAMEAGMQRLREAFLEIITHLSDVLADPGKKFKDVTVEKPKRFLEEVKHLNIWGDEAFFKLLEKTQRLLDGVEADDLRDDEKYREAVGQQVKKVIKQFDNLPTTRLHRRLEI